MKDFIILPDVTCDLSPELAQRFGLVDYIRGYVHVGDRQLRTTLDWENISRDEFYSVLSNKRISVSSAAASPAIPGTLSVPASTLSGGSSGISCRSDWPPVPP